jgi:Zinc knuckle
LGKSLSTPEELKEALTGQKAVIKASESGGLHCNNRTAVMMSRGTWAHLTAMERYGSPLYELLYKAKKAKKGMSVGDLSTAIKLVRKYSFSLIAEATIETSIKKLAKNTDTWGTVDDLYFKGALQVSGYEAGTMEEKMMFMDEEIRTSGVGSTADSKANRRNQRTPYNSQAMTWPQHIAQMQSQSGSGQGGQHNAGYMAESGAMSRRLKWENARTQSGSPGGNGTPQANGSPAGTASPARVQYTKPPEVLARLAAAKIAVPKVDVCFGCGWPGHFARNCPTYPN